MRLLLDTHALIWWWTDDPRLSAAARQAVLDPSHEVLVSSASAWEIATKQRLGKLGLPDAAGRLQELVAQDGFTHWPITWKHGQRAGGYRQDHRDPFDRMLAAQAELDELTLVTCDAALGEFPVNVLW
jgi:PIN domain nuclease of toxin-antitoxin system